MCPTMLRVSYNRISPQVMDIKKLNPSVSYFHAITFSQVQKSDDQVMVSTAISPMTYLGYFFLLSSLDNIFLFI